MSRLGKATYWDCPTCDASLAVVLNEDDDFSCLICASLWTKYTWPAGVVDYIRNEQRIHREGNTK